MRDEERLKEKLRAIEALFAGATTDGEKVAAGLAQERIAARLEVVRNDVPVEWQFSLTPWSRKLFIALARRYELTPYRYKRQRRTTLVVRASERFLQETFIPQFDRMVDTLFEHLDAVTERVVAEVVHTDMSEAVVKDEPLQLEVFATKNEGSSR